MGKSVYLAGPISGDPDFFARFISAEGVVKDAAPCVRVVSPVFARPDGVYLDALAPGARHCFGADSWWWVEDDRYNYFSSWYGPVAGVEVEPWVGGSVFISWESGEKSYVDAKPGVVFMREGGAPDWLDWMRACLRLLSECDGVVLLPGWDESRGARLEREVGVRLGLPVVELEEFVRLRGELKWV